MSKGPSSGVEKNYEQKVKKGCRLPLTKQRAENLELNSQIKNEKKKTATKVKGSGSA